MDATGTIIAAGIWSSWVWPLLQFIIGLGIVVFVHELGHFLVAKAVGIRVECFALGFGPRLLAIQFGETEYSIRLLPLGGYIKMLGQDDFRPRQEIEQEDSRSYNAKPVWARLAVVSAGVVMNAILALGLFVLIAMLGRNFPAPVIGEVRRHYPASQAKITWQSGAATQPGAAATQPGVSTGLKPGDRVTQVDGEGAILGILGNEVTRFDRLALLSVTADRDETFELTIERDVDGNTRVGTTELGVRLGPSEMGGRRLSFGISPARDTVVVRTLEFRSDKRVDPFEKDDRVLAVGGKPLRQSWDLQRAMAGRRGPTVPVMLRRKGKEVQVEAPRTLQLKESVLYLADGTKVDAEDYENIGLAEKDGEEVMVFKSLVDGKETTRKKADVIAARSEEILDLLGMVPRLRITGIVSDSAAEVAKLQPGDVIVHYGDTPLPTIGKLRKVSAKVAGSGTQIVVERDGKRIEPIKIDPRRKKGGAFIGVCRHLDLASTVVAGVRPGSPAAKAGIEPGYVIDKINDRAVASWLEVFDTLKSLEGKEITLTYRRSDTPEAEPATAAIGTLDRQAFDPNDYEQSIFPGPHMGFYETLQVTLRQETLGGALGWAVRETGGFMVTTYSSIRSLFKGNVSKEEFLGPVGMGGIAVQAARQDIMHLVYFMAFLSAILAVINFLPLPVVDGGHAVFLIIEKIRGKPVPVKVMNIVQMIGLALILLLFVAITFQDITRFF